MAVKILVANDSSTIQKVVSITLSETPYEITECLSEDDLFNKIKESSFDLILLDYSLSEHINGSELSKKIISMVPNQLIMLMLGAFDSISDRELERSGAKDKIVKPFDGHKLLEKCLALIEGNRDLDQEREMPLALSAEKKGDDTPKDQSKEISEDDLDDTGEWQVDAPEVISSKEDVDAEEVTKKIYLSAEDKQGDKAKDGGRIDQQDQLASEVEDWGIPIPGVIGKSDSILVPPIIGEDKSTEAEAASAEPVAAFEDTAQADSSEGDLSLKMVSMDDLLHEEDKSVSRENIIEEGTPNDLWAVDDQANVQYDSEPDSEPDYGLFANNDIKEAEQVEQTGQNETIKVEDREVEERPSVVVDEEMIEKVKESISPIVEKLVKEYCKETVERVAWEIMPDLAENLIKKELQEISESVKNN